MLCRAHASAQKGMTRSDRVRLGTYVEFDDISEVVNSAISQSSLGQKLFGGSGVNVDQGQRYIFVKDLGWVDLQHVVSASTAIGSSIGLSIDLGHAAETVQALRGFDSGFRTEDLVSNFIGSMASHDVTFRGGASIGGSVQRIIGGFQHMSELEAIKYIDINGSKELDL